MTNYSEFPVWRAKYGIVIKFNEDSYAWSKDTNDSREYLLESSFLDNAEYIFIGWLDKWFNVNEYKEFINKPNYHAMKTNALKKFKKN